MVSVKSYCQILSCVLLILFGGCGHYKFGVGPDLGFSTIHIPPIKNSSLASNVSSVFTSTLINSIQQKLPYKITQKSMADLILEIEILSLKETELAVNHSDTSISIAFLEDIEVKCSLVSSDNDCSFFVDKKVYAHLPVDVVMDVSVSRDQIIAKIANILADRIVELISNVW